MATAKKMAGRKVSEDEVKTAEHDRVLMHLIARLDDVVGSLYSKLPSWVASAAGEARREATDRWESDAKYLIQMAGEGNTFYRMGIGARMDEGKEPLTDELRARLTARATELSGWARLDLAIQPNPSAFKAFAKEGYETMKLVSARKQMSSGRNSVTPAGFVDMALTVVVPSSLVLGGASGDKSAYESLRHYSGIDEIERFLTELTRENVKFHYKVKEFPLWISVRVGNFTLGEVLQELKQLKQLEERNQTVALVVDAIDPVMASHIRHEGFHVVELSKLPA